MIKFFQLLFLEFDAVCSVMSFTFDILLRSDTFFFVSLLFRLHNL